MIQGAQWSLCRSALPRWCSESLIFPSVWYFGMLFCVSSHSNITFPRFCLCVFFFILPLIWFLLPCHLSDVTLVYGSSCSIRGKSILYRGWHCCRGSALYLHLLVHCHCDDTLPSRVSACTHTHLTLEKLRGFITQICDCPYLDVLNSLNCVLKQPSELVSNSWK